MAAFGSGGCDLVQPNPSKTEAREQPPSLTTVPEPIRCATSEIPVSAVLRAPDTSVDPHKAARSAFGDLVSYVSTASGLLLSENSESSTLAIAKIRIDFCMNPSDNSLRLNRLIEVGSYGQTTIKTYGIDKKPDGEVTHYYGLSGGYNQIIADSVKSSGLFAALTTKDTTNFSLIFNIKIPADEMNPEREFQMEMRKTSVPGVVAMNHINTGAHETTVVGILEISEKPDLFFTSNCYNSVSYRHLFKKEGMYEFNIEACHFPGDRAYIPVPISFTANILDKKLLDAGLPSTLKGTNIDETLKTLVVHHGIKFPSKGITVRANGVEFIVRGFGDMDQYPICAGWRQMDSQKWQLLWTESEQPKDECRFDRFLPGGNEGWDSSFEFFAKRSRDIFANIH